MKWKNECIMRLSHTIILPPASELNPDSVRFYRPIDGCLIVPIIYVIVKGIRGVLLGTMMGIGEAFGWHVSRFISLVELTPKVQVRRAVASGVSWSILVAHSAMVFGAMYLPVTERLTVEADRVTGCAVSSIIYLLGTVFKDGLTQIHVQFGCSYWC